MKKAYLGLLLTTLLVFTACSPVGVVGEQVKEVAGASYSLGYLYFNDTRKLILRLDQPTQVTLQVLSTGGELDVSLWALTQSGSRVGEALYQGADLPTGHWPVPLEAGHYEFEFQGRKHMGSISVYYGASRPLS